MRKLRTGLVAAIALSVTLTVSGCIQPDPVITPAPQQSVEPIFESEEEALAAAEEAYARFVEVSDAISADGGKSVERILEFVDPSYQQTVVDSFASFVDRKLRTEGRTTFDTVSLQQYSDVGGEAVIDIYVCVDVSGVRVLNDSGVDVTPVDRQDRLPLEVGLRTDTGNSNLMTITKSDSWTGSNFCDA